MVDGATNRSGSRLAIALVGCGRWGKHVLRDLVSLDCEVTVVARSDTSVACARDGGAARIVSGIDELPAVGGVVVVTPTATHAQVVADALELGVPVFVEKPLCEDPADADQLVSAAPDRLFVMDKWRYHPGVLELAAIARSRELGAVASLHCRRVSDVHMYDDVDPVLVLAPHDLAIGLEILGAVPPAVSAVEEWSGGRRVGMQAVLGGPPWLTFEVSSVAPGHRREVRLVCEDGVAHLDGGYADQVVIKRAHGAYGSEPERRAIADEMPLLAELRVFVEHLEGGPPPRSSAAEGAGIVRRIAELGALAAPTRPSSKAALA